MDMELELGREGRGEEKQETELTYIKNFGLTIRTRWMDEPWRWRGCGLGYSVLLLEEKGRGLSLLTRLFVLYHGAITSSLSFDFLFCFFYYILVQVQLN